MPQYKAAPDDSVGAFVLAGGESSRMGRDKALIPLAGRPLIAHAVSILRDAGLEPSIAGARSDLSGFAHVIPDPSPGLGPLSGICAALESSSARFSVFIPVDLPLIPHSLISYLVRHAQTTTSAVTLVSICGVESTFPVVLDRRVLPALKSEMAAGRRGCLTAFKSASTALDEPVSIVPVEFVAQSAHASHPIGVSAAFWFLNVNSPDDLERLAGRFSMEIA